MAVSRAFLRFARLATAIAWFLAAPASSAASLSDVDLLRGSSHVVDAKVARTTSHWDESRKLILTTVELDVTASIFSRGPATGPHCSLEVLGGEIDGVGLAISEAPRFKKGERVIVFVKPWGRGRLTVTRGAEGLFHVDASGRVERRAIGAAQYAARIRSLAK